MTRQELLDAIDDARNEIAWMSQRDAPTDMIARAQRKGMRLWEALHAMDQEN